MNQIKTQAELVDKYPKLFTKVKHIECDDGWVPLLDRMFCSIMNYWETEWIPEEHRNDLHIEQLKEKFGLCRCYMSVSIPFVEGIVVAIETMSGTICEQCGQPGSRRRGGWIKTLCNTCDDERRVK